MGEYQRRRDGDLKGKTHSDLSRFKTGGLGVQFISVWRDGNHKNPFAFANRQKKICKVIVLNN